MVALVAPVASSQVLEQVQQPYPDRYVSAVDGPNGELATLGQRLPGAKLGAAST